MKNQSNARKTSKTPTKIYTYGAFLPQDPAQQKLIADQIWNGHKYRNKLVEIERSRREQFRQLRLEISPKLVELNKSVVEIDLFIKDLLVKLGGKDASENPLHPLKTRASDSIAKEIKSLKDKKKIIFNEISSINKSINKDYFDDLDLKFKELKTERLASKATELNKSSIGPNDPIRRQIVDDLITEMTQSANPFWIKKIGFTQNAEKLNREARANCNVNPGSYLAIETSAKKSFSDSKTDPKFSKFNGEGKVGVQLTDEKGLSIQKALAGTNPVLKIELKPEVRLANNTKKKKTLAIARMKISGSSKSGMFLDIPFIMHRTMPDDSVIKWCYLITKKIGYRLIYEIQFTIESETFKQIKDNKSGTIAINLGWRSVNEGIKYGTTFDGQNTEDLIFNHKLVNKNNQSKFLLSVSDHYFNEVKKEFSNWLKTANITDELKSEVEFIHAWKAHEKLVKISKKFSYLFLSDNINYKLWSLWRKYRCHLDDNMKKTHIKFQDLFTYEKKFGEDYGKPIPFEEVKVWLMKNQIVEPNAQMAFYLMIWANKEKHTVDCARNITNKLRLYRREEYRKLAKKFSDQYENVVIEDWDKSKTAQTPSVENDTRTEQEKNANAIRQFVGVSVLADALKQKFGKENYHELDPDNISKLHFVCNKELITDALYSNKATCTHCKIMIDGDFNAAANLHKRFRERSGAPQNPVPARKVPKTAKLKKKLVDNMSVSP